MCVICKFDLELNRAHQIDILFMRTDLVQV